MFLLHFPNVWAVVLSCELNMYCLYAVRSLLYHVADLQQITSSTNRRHIREVWRAVAEGCLCPGLTDTVVKHCVVLWQMGGNTLQTFVFEAYEVLRTRPPTVIFYYSVNCLGHCTDVKNEVKNDCNDVRLKLLLQSFRTCLLCRVCDESFYLANAAHYVLLY